MDAILLAGVEAGLRMIVAIGPGILASIMGTADDEAALELARDRARAGIAKIRATPVDDAVRDAIAAHAASAPAPTVPTLAVHRRVVERLLVSPGLSLSHEERDALRALVGTP